MPNLLKLRHEHAQLIEIVGRLSRTISQPNPPSMGDLFQIRHELTSTLIVHLKAEDWVLYPRLFASPDPRVTETAFRLCEEMGGLAGAYAAHTDKWTAHSIASDWPGYCTETREILDALSRRISREDQELYPMLETFEQAA
jgi:hemerythrin-like domain-containing protein